MNLIKAYESSKDSNKRISEIQNPKESLKAQKGRNLSCTIRINIDQTKQVFKGFGGAITESAGYVLSKLSDEESEKIIKSYYGSEKESNGYTFARTHMNSCDFSLGNWACAQEKDETLSNFSFKQTDKYMTPYLKAAKKINGNLKILVSPWSPPAWMKTNSDMNKGGKLKEEYRALWAEYFVRFIKGLGERNLNVNFVSIQNEPDAAQPWDSCLWTGTEEAEFAVNFLRPAFNANGLQDVKILAWDHNRDLLFERMKESFSVPGANGALDGMAYHWYSGDQYENVAKCHELHPDKELFFSEGCVEGGSRKGKWYIGERYGHNIINDLNNGCTAWIDWNIALDTNGGPNHAGNYCDAPVLVDTQDGKVFYQSSFYYIGHFSRFITPLSKNIPLRIEGYHTPATADGEMGNTMEATAFVRPDGKKVLVVMNRTEDDMVFFLDVRHFSVQDKQTENQYTVVIDDDKEKNSFVCPPRGIQTYIFE